MSNTNQNSNNAIMQKGKQSQTEKQTAVESTTLKTIKTIKEQNQLLNVKQTTSTSLDYTDTIFQQEHDKGNTFLQPIGKQKKKQQSVTQITSPNQTQPKQKEKKAKIKRTNSQQTTKKPDDAAEQENVNPSATQPQTQTNQGPIKIASATILLGSEKPLALGTLPLINNKKAPQISTSKNENENTLTKDEQQMYKELNEADEELINLIHNSQYLPPQAQQYRQTFQGDDFYFNQLSIISSRRDEEEEFSDDENKELQKMQRKSFTNLMPNGGQKESKGQNLGSLLKPIRNMQAIKRKTYRQEQIVVKVNVQKAIEYICEKSKRLKDRMELNKIPEKFLSVQLLNSKHFKIGLNALLLKLVKEEELHPEFINLTQSIVLKVEDYFLACLDKAVLKTNIQTEYRRKSNEINTQISQQKQIVDQEMAQLLSQDFKL